MYYDSIESNLKEKLQVDLQIYLNLIELLENMKNNAITCFKKYVVDNLTKDSIIFCLIKKEYVIAYKNSLNDYIANMK